VTTDADGGLFAVPERPAGRVEKGLQRSVAAGRAAGTLVDEDEGLIEGAFVAARALDRAETLPDKSAVYAVAQLMRPVSGRAERAAAARRAGARHATAAGPGERSADCGRLAP
jgi:hypothetical protein